MTNEEKAKEIAKDYSDVELDSKTVIYEACVEIAQWKDEQRRQEKAELLGLVKMLPVGENNQTIVEDLIGILR